jgi:hypothetical protein
LMSADTTVQYAAFVALPNRMAENGRRNGRVLNRSEIG